jgi:hypothetical protein
MAARSDQKILRIGIIQGGKVVEERLVRERRDVTLGSGPKNTFIVPASSLPKRFKLFEVRGGAYHLSFSDQMTGRVAAGNGVVDFSSLKSQNLAKKKGGVFTYPLPESARGKVSMGDVTLLFQFVPPPPEPPKMLLPKEARGGWVKSIDKIFTAILAVSLLIHVSSLVYLSGLPPPPKLTIDQIPDRFAKLIVPERKEMAQVELEGTQPRDEEPQETKKEASEEKRDRSEEEIRKRAESREVKDAVAQQGILKIIGTKGATGGSVFADLLDRGGRSESLDEALARSSGVRTAGQGEDIRGPAGGDGDRRADIGDLATQGAGEVDRGARQTAQVRGGIQQGAIEADSSTVDAEQIGRFIRSRQQAIQACYESELRRNPQLRGRLLVNISISTTGRVSAVDFLEDSVGSSAVANCVRTRIRTWVFPVRPAEETAVSVPFIFAPAT